MHNNKMLLRIQAGDSWTDVYHHIYIAILMCSRCCNGAQVALDFTPSDSNSNLQLYPVCRPLLAILFPTTPIQLLAVAVVL